MSYPSFISTPNKIDVQCPNRPRRLRPSRPNSRRQRHRSSPSSYSRYSSLHRRSHLRPRRTTNMPASRRLDIPTLRRKSPLLQPHAEWGIRDRLRCDSRCWCFLPLGLAGRYYDDLRARVPEGARHCCVLDYIQPRRWCGIAGELRAELSLREWDCFGWDLFRPPYSYGCRMVAWCVYLSAVCCAA